jgi:hypothetical protein
MTALEVFKQNDGDVTKAYYADMNSRGPAGQLAVALFRAQKRSTAAKKYRGGKYRRAAYEVKNYSLSEVCRILTAYPDLGLRWGWKDDPKTPGFTQVLYVNLPQGQCSFHSSDRLNGPEYPDDWDGAHASTERILAYCDAVANSEAPRPVAPAPQTTGVIVCGRHAKPTRFELELARGGGRLTL